MRKKGFGKLGSEAARVCRFVAFELSTDAEARRAVTWERGENAGPGGKGSSRARRGDLKPLSYLWSAYCAGHLTRFATELPGFVVRCREFDGGTGQW